MESKQTEYRINPATHADRFYIASLLDEMAGLAKALAEKDRLCMMLELEVLKLKTPPAPAE